MKHNIKILYGGNLLEKIPCQEVSKVDFFNPLLKWAGKIKNQEEYENFESYLLNILTIIKEDGYLNEEAEIEKIISQLARNLSASADR
jgi:hypothetical protein